MILSARELFSILEDELDAAGLAPELVQNLSARLTLRLGEAYNIEVHTA